MGVAFLLVTALARVGGVHVPSHNDAHLPTWARFF